MLIRTAQEMRLKSLAELESSKKTAGLGRMTTQHLRLIGVMCGEWTIIMYNVCLNNRRVPKTVG